MVTPIHAALSEHLPALQKVDKSDFVLSFIQEQQANAKIYASAGQAFVTSWDDSLPSTSKSPHPISQQRQQIDYGFGTPVLKPRVQSMQQNIANHALPDVLQTWKTKTSVEHQQWQPGKKKRKRTNSQSPEENLKLQRNATAKPNLRKLQKPPRAKAKCTKVTNAATDNNEATTRKFMDGYLLR